MLEALHLELNSREKMIGATLIQRQLFGKPRTALHHLAFLRYEIETLDQLKLRAVPAVYHVQNRLLLRHSQKKTVVY